MRNKIKIVANRVYQFISPRIKDKVFGCAVVVSIMIWILFTLSGSFNYVVSIPVNIHGSLINGNPSITSEVKNFDIDSKISGTGFSIIKYLIFRNVNVNITDLIVSNIKGSEYAIDIASLEKAVNSKLEGVDLINMYVPRIVYNTLKFESKKVPVKLDLDIERDGQFMQVGDIVLEPSEITITGPDKILDSISSVHSEYFKIKEKNTKISGMIGLSPIKEVAFSEDNISYEVQFERYTEVKIKRRVIVINSNRTVYTIFPDMVELTLNVAENYYNEYNLEQIPVYVRINQDENLGDNKYIVRCGNIPVGVELRSVNPNVVTVFRGKVD